MSGITQATFMNLRSFAPPPPPPDPGDIGTAYEGGFYAGDIGVSGVATHHLVIGPLSTAQTQLQWKNANTGTPGAGSAIDGPQNTADMVADGNSTVYPCAHFCNNAVIGGFSDWYMPAQNELELCYFNLKPTTALNTTFAGANSNAVPVRIGYTAGNPAQTSAAAFQTGGAEAFIDNAYWSSTERVGNYADPTKARRQFFSNGTQGAYGYADSKTSSHRVRAVRRVPVNI